ncbi:MAG: alpha/beta hydrolase, partial [Acutalibacteraceae bacterium]
SKGESTMDIIKLILKLNWKAVGKSDQKRIDSQTPTAGIRQILDIPYINDSEKGHLLDIYYPEGTVEKLPVIIDIHGGGWMYGYKEINKYYCLKLASKGFLVASVNYRLVDDVLFPDQVKDIFSALGWLSDHLADYPADTENVFLTGDSAGGHLSCVTSAVCLDKTLQRELGVTPPAFSFNAVAVVSPAVNLYSNPVTKLMPKILLGSTENAAYEKYLDFGRIAKSGLPPFIIITSSGDFIRKQSYELKEILDKLGVRNHLSDYVVLLDGKKLQHVFSVTDPYSGPGERAVTEVTDFFKSNVKVKA